MSTSTWVRTPELDAFGPWILPVLTPVLIGATRAFDAALGGAPSDGWPWCGLLVAFALAYLVVGTLAFGPLLEES